MKTRTCFISFAALLLALLVTTIAFAGPLTLIYYDGHMHTWRQGGNGEVSDIKATAQSRGLSAVIITDHCEGLDQETWASLVADCEDATEENFLALPAFEVTGSDGIFNRTHVNALGVADPFVGNDSDCLCPEEVWPSPPNPEGTGAVYPENVTKWVDYIHSQGGIAVQNHPSGSTLLSYGVNCMEVYNQGHVDDVIDYAKMLGYTDQEAWQFGILLNNLAINGEDPALNQLMPNPGFPGPALMPMRDILWWATLLFSGVGQWLGAPEAPLSSWDNLLMAYVNGTVQTPIFGLANSDAHNTGDPDSKVGVAKNGAYVKKLTADELYKAIKKGRTFATSGPSLALDVNSELMGDTAYVYEGGSATIKLSVSSESMTKVVAMIVIVKNGVIWDTIYPMYPFCENTFDDAVTEDGYYRIEVTTVDVFDGSYQFAWSNPVFVRILN